MAKTIEVPNWISIHVSGAAARYYMCYSGAMPQEITKTAYDRLSKLLDSLPVGGADK